MIGKTAKATPNKKVVEQAMFPAIRAARTTADGTRSILRQGQTAHGNRRTQTGAL
jgi:hypothetical protein